MSIFPRELELDMSGLDKLCVSTSGSQLKMDYEQQHAALKQYLLAKVAIADWHGVSDAANDLRVLEAQMGIALCKDNSSALAE